MIISNIFFEDCMIGMSRFPDKFFDLAIIDAPYGIGEDGKRSQYRGNVAPPKLYTPKKWDRNPPTKEYFNELFRVSQNQIVFGANHFIENINRNSTCWIVWDKDNSAQFADCELAWTSFNSTVRKFKWRWNGMLQEKMGSLKEIRIHPTQKPVALYKWLLDQYAESGNKILDTHMGSQSSRIAAYQLGFDYWGWEIDQEYFMAGDKRFKEQIAQLKLL